ncbi:MAG: hypothetical protein LBR73_09520 [Oscillospiraceae bacterium]|jgi:hypothetical protein|nr:hypothetical protein [Oscillospiraceae bacterium]
MKRTAALLALACFTAAALFLTACGTKKTADSTEKAAASETESNALYAEVVDVIGNQLTLKVLRGSYNVEEMAQRYSEMQSGSGVSRQNQTNADGEEVTRGEGGGGFRGGFANMTDADGNAVTFPEGGMPDFASMTDANGEPVTFAFRTDMTDAEGNTVTRPAMTDADGNTITMPSRETATDAEGNTVDPRYTGEEKEVIIPIGVPIEKVSFSDGELTKTSVEISDIKNGNTVNVLYAADGSTVTGLQIIDSTSRRGAGGGMGGGGTGGGGMFVVGNGGGNAVFYGAGPGMGGPPM